MVKIRILIIEDNRILREGIAEALGRQKDVAVAAISGGSDEALKKAGVPKPQVVLIDLGLESPNCLEIVKAAKREYPGVKVIGMGLIPAQSDIMEFVQAGAEGFILKSATVEEVLETIRAVAGGQTVLPAAMAGSLFSQVAEYALQKGNRNLKSDVRMTVREKEVIALIMEGMSNKRIAESLDIATFTVKSHIHNIMEKLALHSRLQIANHAREQEKD
jgi:DNA-binding NarL/FixJ family response regulator